MHSVEHLGLNEPVSYTPKGSMYSRDAIYPDILRDYLFKVAFPGFSNFSPCWRINILDNVIRPGNKDGVGSFIIWFICGIFIMRFVVGKCLEARLQA